jgi:hypothetical protein
VADDPALQVERLLGRIEPEFFGQPPPVVLEGSEGAGLVSGGGQRPHQRQVGRLPQGFGGDGLLGEHDRLPEGAPTHGGGGRAFKAFLMGPEQRGPVALGPIRVGILGERIATPPLERGAKLPQRRLGVGRRGSPALDPGQKDLRVHRPRVVVDEQVAAAAGDERRGLTQRSAGPIDQNVEARSRVRRRGPRPQRLDQEVPGDEFPPTSDQDANEGPDQPASERAGRNFLSAPPDREPPEHTDLALITGHGRNCLGDRYRAATWPLYGPVETTALTWAGQHMGGKHAADRASQLRQSRRGA